MLLLAIAIWCLIGTIAFAVDTAWNYKAIGTWRVLAASAIAWVLLGVIVLTSKVVSLIPLVVGWAAGYIAARLNDGYRRGVIDGTP